MIVMYFWQLFVCWLRRSLWTRNNSISLGQVPHGLERTSHSGAAWFPYSTSKIANADNDIFGIPAMQLA